MKSVFKVIQSGIAGILVDNGRVGYQHLGFSPSGPLDEVGYFWANALAGNIAKSGAVAALELIASTQFEAQTRVQFCVAGPGCSVQINGNNVESWTSLSLETGDTLSITSERIGQRYYLAIKGGFSAQAVLGSKSTTLKERIGGFNGKSSVIKDNDMLFMDNDVDSRPSMPNRVEEPDYGLQQPIRVIEGYQAEELGRVCRSQFFSQTFTLSSESNRMGYRLDGESLPSLNRAFFSEGLHSGAIQIPPNGLPIVMLAERQTLGGYPKIGAIARLDLYRFAQSLPGDEIRFEPIDVYSARNQWRLRMQNWQNTLENFQ
jgi:biotin-dependent carboxylase-like uncharacterized protein